MIATWKGEFGSFWPKGNSFYGPITGIAPGEVAVLNLAVPGNQTLSTGVMVIYADEESFTFMTPEGHMFASWITFSAFRDGATPVVQIEVLLRANDPIYEVSMALFGHKQENAFWLGTLHRLAARFGVEAEATMEADLRRPQAPVAEREEHPLQRRDPLGDVDRDAPASLVPRLRRGVTRPDLSVHGRDGSRGRVGRDGDAG